jgi:hypothetical protein
VCVKLTPEICINKASSNSRLTAVGRWATASDSHSQNCLQTLFIFSPFLWLDNNQTTPACWKTYWNCIAFELRTLCGVFFCFVLLCFAWFGFFSPLMRQKQNYFWDTISRIGGWGTNTKIIKTEIYCIRTWRFFFLFYYYYYNFYSFIIFFSILSLSF